VARWVASLEVEEMLTIARAVWYKSLA